MVAGVVVVVVCFMCALRSKSWNVFLSISLAMGMAFDCVLDVYFVVSLERLYRWHTLRVVSHECLVQSLQKL